MVRKFKVGDRVIVTSNTGENSKYPYVFGYEFVISQRVIDYNSMHGNSNFYCFHEDDHDWTIESQYLELAEIYNSPLYKAMQEDE